MLNNKNTLFRTSNNSVKTIGVAFPFFWTGTSSQLLNGIRDVSEQLGINLLFFQGFYCNMESYFNNDFVAMEEIGTIVYDIINCDALDGLIINTGGFKSHTDKLILIEMCKKFAPLPMVSVGSAVEGLANIVIDNSQAIQKILNHLVGDHKRKKIGFLRGPADNNDSNERFDTYCKFLQNLNIQINPDWISPPGIWNSQLASEAARSILRKTNNDIDAIICNGDVLANAVIEMLKSMGIKVPQEIAVIGFNNDPIAQACFPPITTIDRNLYGRGWKAVESILGYYEGFSLTNDLFVDSKVILRQSCGCLYAGSRALNSMFTLESADKAETLNEKTMIDKLKKDLVNTLNIPITGKIVEWCDTFVDSFFLQLRDTKANVFLSTFDKILHDYSEANYEVNRWYYAINEIEMTLKADICTDETRIQRMFLNRARVFLSEKLELIQKIKMMHFEDLNVIINTLSHSFCTISKVEVLVDLLAEELPKLGFTSCYLSLYEDSNNPIGYCKLVLGYNKNGRISIPPEGIRFEASELIPQECNHPGVVKSLFLEPLYYGYNHLGFTLFEFDKIYSSFYELFPAQLSAALWSSVLNSKIRRAEGILKEQAHKLIESNQVLHEKVSLLEKAYQQIEENQDKLLLSEKMASLGKLTAGIVHEMNTPLVTVRASLTELEILIKEYNESIGDENISDDDHLEIANEINESIQLAEKATLRAADFIKSIKAQTRDNKTQEKQVFNVLEIIQTVLIFLGHSLRHSNCKVEIQCDSDKIEVNGSPTKMTQIFTNLITNAIDALEEITNKKIIVALEQNQRTMKIKVSDNGCGIPQKNIEKIFDLLFTTKPFGHGTGLGLSIISDIVSNDFGGTVAVESELGKGTTFIIEMETI